MFFSKKFFYTEFFVGVLLFVTLFAGCSKALEYKRRKPITNTGNDTPTTNPTPAPSPTPENSSVKFLELPKSSSLIFNDKFDVIIENLRFEDIDGIALNIRNSTNIIVRNCFFNRATKEAINIEGCKNILIENCLFNGIQTGVYVMQSETIKVRNNQFVNVRKRADGGRGQFVQFNSVTGIGNLVEDNKGENFFNESNPEDLVSMFRTHGTASNPVYIRNNIFRGGGPSVSGGGIMTGDHGGSYINVENNILVDPGQYGIACAGGTNITIINNKMFAKQQSFSNNPLYVWAQIGVSCSDIYIKSNHSNWYDKNGYNNRGWNAGNCLNTFFEYAKPTTIEEINTPAHLINFITPEELIQIRK